MRRCITLGLIVSTSGLASSPERVIAEANKSAALEPSKTHFVNASMVFDYEQGRLYQIYTRPERISDIAFEIGENVLAIGGGDSQRWTISETQSGKDAFVRKHIFVKPHQLGISTNLVITTDRRTYHIEIHSQANVPYQASVTWKYPGSNIIIVNDMQDHQGGIRAKTPVFGLGQSQLNFNYHFVASDRPAWMPRRVFDDSHKTYVEFPESMQDNEAPILYGLSRAKEKEVLNYRRYRNFYIIDHLIDTVELSIGGKTAVKVGIERERG